eukprot:3017336-Pyramimonas_sp.AAC.1
MLQNPRENQCFGGAHLFASEAHPRPQYGAEMSQLGPDRGPREPQDCHNSVQERSKSDPRG